MPELRTRADFIKALPKKFPGIHKLYKLSKCKRKVFTIKCTQNF